MASINKYLTAIQGAVFTAPFCALFLLLVIFSSGSVQAKGIYQTGPEFITEVFGKKTAEKKTLWLTEDIRQQTTKILGRVPTGLRVRYHQSEEKTAWILEEIGKELPITIGVVVSNQQIEQVKILAFRESRGGEVRYPAYTAQYKGASLTQKHKLSKHIDGITGATLSVWAVNKVATLALYYHSQVISAATD